MRKRKGELDFVGNCICISSSLDGDTKSSRAYPGSNSGDSKRAHSAMCWWQPVGQGWCHVKKLCWRFGFGPNRTVEVGGHNSRLTLLGNSMCPFRYNHSDEQTFSDIYKVCAYYIDSIWTLLILMDWRESILYSPVCALVCQTIYPTWEMEIYFKQAIVNVTVFCVWAFFEVSLVNKQSSH